MYFIYVLFDKIYYYLLQIGLRMYGLYKSLSYYTIINIRYSQVLVILNNIHLLVLITLLYFSYYLYYKYYFFLFNNFVIFKVPTYYTNLVYILALLLFLSYHFYSH